VLRRGGFADVARCSIRSIDSSCSSRRWLGASSWPPGVAGADESGAHVADVAARAEAPRRRANVQRAVVLAGAALGVPVRARRGRGWALTGDGSQLGSVAGGGLIWRFLWARSRARPDVAAPRGVRRRGPASTSPPKHAFDCLIWIHGSRVTAPPSVWMAEASRRVAGVSASGASLNARGRHV
jgi:hypothetical protein